MAVTANISFQGLAPWLQEKDKQLRKAAAAALTWTAQDAVKAIKARLPQEFIIKNSWTAKGIRYIPADARKEPIKAEVYSKDWWINDRDSGGTRDLSKSPYTPRRSVMEEVFGIPKNKVIPRYLKPNRILNSKSGRVKGFRIFDGAKARVPGIYVETDLINGVPGTGKRYKLYNFVRSVRVQKNPWFMEIIAKVRAQTFNAHYKKGIDKYVTEK